MPIGLQCPPMVIHCGKCIQEYWVCDAPVDVHVAAATKGYITKAKFHEYGIRFVRFSQKITNYSTGLTFSSLIHTKAMFTTFLSLRKCLRIIFMLWPYPLHTSHIVQALDSTPFAQFKKKLAKVTE